MRVLSNKNNLQKSPYVPPDIEICSYLPGLFCTSDDVEGYEEEDYDW